MTDWTGPKSCAICARVLDYVQGVGYRHGTAEVEEHDHPAVPVDQSEVQTRPRCDFCYANEVAYVLPARDFVIETYKSVGDWGACTECAPFVFRNQWKRLVQDRILPSRIERKVDGPEDEALVNRLMRKLRQNITGALRKADE